MRKLCAIAVAACVFAIALAVVLPSRASDPPAGAPTRVKVLWIGDDGHHVPLERCRQIFSLLARRGIDITYTDDLADINPANLGRYHCLLVYANIEKIAPDQEKAILEFVAAGHGYVPIHCGSYCFLNSPALTALTGARFKSHGTGVFKEAIAAPDHPIAKGLKPIESWDESYVHEMHNEKDREVLAYREEGGRKEPYTWTRAQGAGRVFYTAWGHDQRTWGNADFQNLLERGIKWSAGDWALRLQPPAVQPFDYADARLPNYQPNKPTDKTGGETMRMQQPVSPEESVKHIVLPPGFEARLFVSEPQVKKPICMAWDERGRLWVAETMDYPNEMQPEGQGRDRITICEDTDGDGKADKFTIFADKLSIPTSLCFADGGVIVAQAPHLLFLKDTDGDGKADVRRVLFTGFGAGDTHAGPSNLHWGFDNWIYATVGYSGFNGAVAGQALSFGQGVFRFKADGSKLEFVGSTTNNTWGLGFSEDNQIFMSTANGAPSFHLSIPNRYYEQVTGLNVKRLEPIMDSDRFYPLTEHVRQVDFHGGYTAAAGHALYTARSLPRDYWNRIAFVAEPTGHLVGQYIMQADGSGFRARDDFNFLSSDDEWTAPIAAEVGPDGAVWVIDWYNFIVQHNPIPQGFERGRGNAYVTPLRDKRHGRIYRVVYPADAKPTPAPNLAAAGIEPLVATLKSDNLLWRMHAQRLLVEKADARAIPALINLADDPAADAIGLNAGAIHALWTLHGLGVFDGSHADATAAARRALSHPSAGVRKVAVDVLPRDAAAVETILAAKTLADADAQVRKSALLALSEMPASESAGSAVYNMLSRKENADDRWIPDAVAIAAARHDAGFLRAVFAAHATKAPAGAAPIVAEQPKNLVPNGSFEDAADGKPVGWAVRHYSGKAKHAIASSARTGTGAVQISSADGADTSWFIDVPVAPHTSYRLAGWIKTQDVQKVGPADGVLFNIHGTSFKTPGLTGTADWRKVEVTFDSGEASVASINCLFGGYGLAKGTAWFDDVSLSPLSNEIGGLPPAESRVVSIVVNQYARRAPTDVVPALLAAVRSTDPALAAAVLGGLVDGWPQGKAPSLTDAEITELRALYAALAPLSRDRLLALVERWGRKDLFAIETVALATELSAQLADLKRDPAERVDAARRLVAVVDSPSVVSAIVTQITPQAPPDLQAGLLDALSSSRSPAVGEALIGEWARLTPAAQKAALALLLRREPWTRALLVGVRSGAVNGKDLLPQQWQTLTTHPNPEVAALAKELQKSTGREVSADRKQIVEKFLPLAKQPGDSAAGRLVFEKNCAVCHTLDGKGGQVGPDLTGIGARPKADNLIDILDPNRSVEGNYRQWTARTADDVVTGRLFSESKTSIELLDAAGQKHAIQRDKLEALAASDRSLMPEGFEQLPAKDLTDLLEYLATSKVKH